jgi:hypothetical protein
LLVQPRLDGIGIIITVTPGSPFAGDRSMLLKQWIRADVELK